MTLALRVAGLACIGLGLWMFTYLGVGADIGEERTLGLRGLQRRRALRESTLFATLSPVMRFLSRAMRLVPLGGARPRIAALLTHAGDWLGLDVNEFLGLTVASVIGTLAVGAPLVFWLELPLASVIFVAGLGAVLPYILVTGEAQRRARTIDRALPGAIDLGALCMTAGLSFPQAIAQIVSHSGDSRDPLNEELSLILQQLQLGKTRKSCLLLFAERVPTTAVRSFVNATVQSEERGTPIVEVLQIQAQTLRQQRSAIGEQAASRAAVLMVLPLMLILAATIILLLGPFLLQGAASGL